jgi:hypothetical protein
MTSPRFHPSELDFMKDSEVLKDAYLRYEVRPAPSDADFLGAKWGWVFDKKVAIPNGPRPARASSGPMETDTKTGWQSGLRRS